MIPPSGLGGFSDPSDPSPPLPISHDGALYPRTEETASLFFVSPPKPSISSSEDEGRVGMGFQQQIQPVMMDGLPASLPSLCTSSHSVPRGVEVTRGEQGVSWGGEGSSASSVAVGHSQDVSSFPHHHHPSYNMSPAEPSSLPATAVPPSSAFPPSSSPPFPSPSFYSSPFPPSVPPPAAPPHPGAFPSFPPPTPGPSQSASHMSSVVTSSSCPARPYQECFRFASQGGQPPVGGLPVPQGIPQGDTQSPFSAGHSNGHRHIPGYGYHSSCPSSFPNSSLSFSPPSFSPLCSPFVPGRPPCVSPEGSSCGGVEGAGEQRAQQCLSSSCQSGTYSVPPGSSWVENGGSLQSPGNSLFPPCSSPVAISTLGCQQTESGQNATDLKYPELSSSSFLVPSCSSSSTSSSGVFPSSFSPVSSNLSHSSSYPSHLPLSGRGPTSQRVSHTEQYDTTVSSVPTCPVSSTPVTEGVSIQGETSPSSPCSSNLLVAQQRPGSSDVLSSSSSSSPPFLHSSPRAPAGSADISSVSPPGPCPLASSLYHSQPSVSTSPLSACGVSPMPSAPVAASAANSSSLSPCRPPLFPSSSSQALSALPSTSSCVPSLPPNCLSLDHLASSTAVPEPRVPQQATSNAKSREKIAFKVEEENTQDSKGRSSSAQSSPSRRFLRVASRFPSTLTVTPEVAAALGLGYPSQERLDTCSSDENFPGESQYFPCSREVYGEDEDGSHMRARWTDLSRYEGQSFKHRGASSAGVFDSAPDVSFPPSFSSILLYLAGSTLEAGGLQDAADVVYAQSRELLRTEKVLTCHDYRGEERVVDSEDRSTVLPSFTGGLKWRVSSPVRGLGREDHGHGGAFAGDEREERATRSSCRSRQCSSSLSYPVSSYSPQWWKPLPRLCHGGTIQIADCRRFLSDLVSLLFSRAPGHMSLQEFLTTCWPAHLPRPLPGDRFRGGDVDSPFTWDRRRRRTSCCLGPSCGTSCVCHSHPVAREPLCDGHGSLRRSYTPLPSTESALSCHSYRPVTSLSARSCTSRTNIFLLHRGRRLRPALSPLLPHSSLASCSDSNSTAAALAVSSAVSSSFVSPLTSSFFPSSTTGGPRRTAPPSSVGLPPLPSGAHLPSTAALLTGSGPSLTSQDSTACWLAWARRVRRVANVWGHQLSHDDLLSGNRPAVEPQFQAGMVREPAAVYVVRYDTSGGAILTGGDDGLIKVWDASSGQLVHVLVKHQGDITDVDLHVNNSLVLSGCGKGEVRLWRLLPGGWLPVCALLVPERVAWARFLTREPLTKGESKELETSTRKAKKEEECRSGVEKAASHSEGKCSRTSKENDPKGEAEGDAAEEGQLFTKSEGEEDEEDTKREADVHGDAFTRAKKVFKAWKGTGHEAEEVDEGLDPISLIVVGCDDGKIRFYDLRNLLEATPIGGPGGRTPVAPLIEVDWGGSYLARAMDLSKVPLDSSGSFLLALGLEAPSDRSGSESSSSSSRSFSSCSASPSRGMSSGSFPMASLNSGQYPPSRGSPPCSSSSSRVSSSVDSVAVRTRGSPFSSGSQPQRCSPPPYRALVLRTPSLRFLRFMRSKQAQEKQPKIEREKKRKGGESRADDLIHEAFDEEEQERTGNGERLAAEIEGKGGRRTRAASAAASAAAVAGVDCGIGDEFFFKLLVADLTPFHAAFPDVCFAWHSPDLVTGGDDTSLYLWSFSSLSSSSSSSLFVSDAGIKGRRASSSSSAHQSGVGEERHRTSYSSSTTGGDMFMTPPPRVRLISLTIQSILQGRYLPGGGGGVNRMRSHNLSENPCSSLRSFSSSSVGFHHHHDCMRYSSSSSSSLFSSRGGGSGATGGSSGGHSSQLSSYSARLSSQNRMTRRISSSSSSSSVSSSSSANSSSDDSHSAGELSGDEARGRRSHMGRRRGLSCHRGGGGQRGQKSPSPHQSPFSLLGPPNHNHSSSERERSCHSFSSAQHAAEASGVRYSLLALCFTCDDELVCIADAVSRRTSRPRASLECVKPLDQAISFFAGKVSDLPFIRALSQKTASNGPSSCRPSSSSYFVPSEGDLEGSGDGETVEGGCRVGSLRLNEGITKSHVSQLKPHPLCADLLLCCTFGGDVLLLDCSEARTRVRLGFGSGLCVEGDEDEEGNLDAMTGRGGGRSHRMFPAKCTTHRTSDNQTTIHDDDDDGCVSSPLAPRMKRALSSRLFHGRRRSGNREGEEAKGEWRGTEDDCVESSASSYDSEKDQKILEKEEEEEQQQQVDSSSAATTALPVDGQMEKSRVRGRQKGRDSLHMAETNSVEDSGDSLAQEEDEEEAERALRLHRSRRRHFIHWDGGCVVLRKIRLGDQCCWLDMAWAPNGLQFAGSHRLGCLSVFTEGSSPFFDISPCEQFLSSECREVRRDAPSLILTDAGTLQPPHLLSRGILLDAARQPYPCHLQPPASLLLPLLSSGCRNKDLYMCSRCVKLRQLGRASFTTRTGRTGEGQRGTRRTETATGQQERSGDHRRVAVYSYGGRKKDSPSSFLGGISVLPCSCCGVLKLFRDLSEFQEIGQEKGRVSCPFCFVADCMRRGEGRGGWTRRDRTGGGTQVERTLLGLSKEAAMMMKLRILHDGLKRRIDGSEKSLDQQRRMQRSDEPATESSPRVTDLGEEREKEKTGFPAFERGLLAGMLARRALSETQRERDDDMEEVACLIVRLLQQLPVGITSLALRLSRALSRYLYVKSHSLSLEESCFEDLKGLDQGSVVQEEVEREMNDIRPEREDEGEEKKEVASGRTQVAERQSDGAAAEGDEEVGRDLDIVVSIHQGGRKQEGRRRRYEDFLRCLFLGEEHQSNEFGERERIGEFIALPDRHEQEEEDEEGREGDSSVTDWDQWAGRGRGGSSYSLPYSDVAVKDGFKRFVILYKQRREHQYMWKMHRCSRRGNILILRTFNASFLQGRRMPPALLRPPLEDEAWLLAQLSSLQSYRSPSGSSSQTSRGGRNFYNSTPIHTLASSQGGEHSSSSLLSRRRGGASGMGGGDRSMRSRGSSNFLPSQSSGRRIGGGPFDDEDDDDSDFEDEEDSRTTAHPSGGGSGAGGAHSSRRGASGGGSSSSSSGRRVVSFQNLSQRPSSGNSSSLSSSGRGATALVGNAMNRTRGSNSNIRTLADHASEQVHGLSISSEETSSGRFQGRGGTGGGRRRGSRWRLMPDEGWTSESDSEDDNDAAGGGGDDQGDRGGRGQGRRSCRLAGESTVDPISMLQDPSLPANVQRVLRQLADKDDLKMLRIAERQKRLLQQQEGERRRAEGEGGEDKDGEGILWGDQLPPERIEAELREKHIIFFAESHSSKGTKRHHDVIQQQPCSLHTVPPTISSGKKATPDIKAGEGNKGGEELLDKRRVEHTTLGEGEWRDDGKERDRVAIGPPEGEESSTEASREDSQSSPSPPQIGSLSADCSSSSSTRLVKPSPSSPRHPLQTSCSSSSASTATTPSTTTSSSHECGLCRVVHACELCKSSSEHFLTVDHRFLNVLEALDGEGEEERSQILQQRVSQNRLDTPVVSIELGEVAEEVVVVAAAVTEEIFEEREVALRLLLRRAVEVEGGGSGPQGGVWMHVRCLMSMSQLDVDCHARGFTNLKTLLEESLHRRCGFCGLKGATVQCVSCPRFFHYPCSLKAYYSSGVLSHTKGVENMRRDGAGHGVLHNGGCPVEEEVKDINEDDEKTKASLKTSKLSALAAAQKLSPYQRTRCLPDSLYFGRYLCFSCRKARHEADVLIPYLTGEVFLSAQTRAWLSSAHRCILSGACLFGKVLPHQGGRSKSSNSFTKYQDSPQQPLPPLGAYCHREAVASCTTETGVNKHQLTPSDGGGTYRQSDTAKFISPLETEENAKSLFSDEEMLENAYKVCVEGVRRGEEDVLKENEECPLEFSEEIRSRNKDTGNVRDENKEENREITSDRAVSSKGPGGEESRMKETERACVKEGRVIDSDAAALFRRTVSAFLDGEQEKKEMRHENIRRLSSLLLSCSYQDRGRHTPPPPCCFTSVGVYVPQLGDVLRYFPQLHQNPVLPHDRIQVWQPELFLPCDVLVEGLSFEFPGLPVDEELPVITAVLTLQVLRPIALRGRRFQVHFSPSCDGGADYLVPLLDVNRGLLRLLQLKEGEGCRAYMDGRFYTGYVSCVPRGPPSLLEALRSDCIDKSSSFMSSSSTASCSSSSPSSASAASVRGLPSNAHPSMLAGAAALSRAEAMKKQHRKDTDHTVKSEEGEKERSNGTQARDGNSREVRRPLDHEEVHMHSSVDSVRVLPGRVDDGPDEGKRAGTSATASLSCSSSHGLASHVGKTDLTPLHASDEGVNRHTGNVSLGSSVGAGETGPYQQQQGRVPVVDKGDNNTGVALCDSEREEEKEKFALNAAIALGKWPSFSTPGVVNCGKLLAKLRRELNTKTPLKSMNEKGKTNNKDQRSPGESSGPQKNRSSSPTKDTQGEGRSRSLFDDDQEEHETKKEEKPLEGRKCMLLNQWEKREEEILSWLARASLGLEAIQVRYCSDDEDEEEEECVDSFSSSSSSSSDSLFSSPKKKTETGVAEDHTRGRGGGGRGRGRHGNTRGRSSSSSHQHGQGSGQHRSQPPSSSPGSSGETEVPGGAGEEDPQHEEQWLNAWEVDFRKGERDREHSRLQRWLQEVEFPRSRQLELFAALDEVMTLTEVSPSHAEEEEEEGATATTTTTLGGGISDDHQHTKALRRSSRRRATPSLGCGPSSDDREQEHSMKGEKEGGDRRTRRQQKMTVKGEHQEEESIFRRRTGGDTRRGGGEEEGDSAMSVRARPAASCTPSSSETVPTPPLFEAFIDPVPLIGNSRSARRSAPLWLQEYWKEIALPISLSLIRERLWYGYYRREAALHADLRLLLADCRQFNPPGDFLHTLSYQLEQELLRRGLFLKKESREEESLLCVHAETQLALAEVLEDMMSQRAVMWACGRERKNKKPVEEEGEGEKGERSATCHKQALPDEERQALMKSSIAGDTVKEKDKGKEESDKPTEEKKLQLVTEPQVNHTGDEDSRCCEATQVEGLLGTSSNLPASSSVEETKEASSLPSYQPKEESLGRASDNQDKLFEPTEGLDAIVPSLSSLQTGRPSPGKDVPPTATVPEVAIPASSSFLSSSQGGSVKEVEAYSAPDLCPPSSSSSSCVPSFSQTTAAEGSVDRAGLPVREEVSQGVSDLDAVSLPSPQKRPMPTGEDDDDDHVFVSPSCTSPGAPVRKTKRRRLRVIGENDDDATAMTQHGATGVAGRVLAGRRTRRGVTGLEQEDQRQERNGEGGDELERGQDVSGSSLNQGGGGEGALSTSRRGRIIKKPSVSYPHFGESRSRKGEQEVEGRRSNQTAIMGVGRRRRLRSSGVLQGDSPGTGGRGGAFGEGPSRGEGMSAAGGEGEANEDLDEDMVLKQVLALSVKTYEEERARDLERREGKPAEPVSEGGECSTSLGKGRTGKEQEGMDEKVPERDVKEEGSERPAPGTIHHRESEASSGIEGAASDTVSRMRGGARRDRHTQDTLGEPFRQPGEEKEEERRADSQEVIDHAPGVLRGHASVFPHIQTPEQTLLPGEEKSSGVGHDADQEENVEGASGEGKDKDASEQQQQEHAGLEGLAALTTERPRKRGRPKGSVRRTVLPQIAKEEEEHEDEEEEEEQDLSDADEDSDEDYEEEDDVVKRRTTRRARGRRGRGRRGRAGRPAKVPVGLSSSGDDTPRRCSGRLAARPGLRDVGLRRSARHHQGGGGDT